ncbi:MAG: CPBP family intramembrane metalloprotease [Clostridiales bacterium]|nr:CPBP family intramembrane metalloprotease [Clostridiales bacterium]
MLNELVGAVAQVLLFSSIPLIVWALTARGSMPFHVWIGLKRPVCEDAARTALLAAAATALYVALTALCMRALPKGVTTASAQFAGQGPGALPAVFVYAFLRTALSEEILFRGFALKRVQAAAGFEIGNAAQALLFGLAHGIPLGLVTRSVWTAILLTLLPGLFGWFEGWLSERRCSGSIIPCILLHGCVNMVTGVVSALS